MPMYVKQLLRSRYVSPIQKTLMLKYLRCNPELISAKFTVDFNHKDAQMKWLEMASMLNRVPGSRKNWKQWRKTWHDMRSKTKVKLQQGSTVFSESEKDVLSLIGELKHENDDVQLEDDELSIKIENCESESSNELPLEQFLSVTRDEPLLFGRNQQNVILEVLDSTDERLGENSSIMHGTDCVDDVSAFDEIDKRSKSKEAYRDSKLKVLQRIARAKEKSAVAKERIAAALEKIAECRTGLL